jgi:hypothetical protein
MTRKAIALLISIICLECLLFVRVPHAAELFPNEPAGFRGIAWGTPLTENKHEMVYVKSNVGIDIYTRKNSKMSIGNAPLSELHYGYAKNRFLVVYIKTASKEDATRLRKEIEKQFGPGPWSGRVGTVVPLRDGASIYSTQLMREQFEQIDAEAKELTKQLMMKYSNGKSDSDF